MYNKRSEAVCVRILQRLRSTELVVQLKCLLTDRFVVIYCLQCHLVFRHSTRRVDCDGDFHGRVPDIFKLDVLVLLLLRLVRTIERVCFFHIVFSTGFDA